MKKRGEALAPTNREGSPMTVGVIAPAAAVPRVELAEGVAMLRDAGFDVRVHPSATGRHLFFSGRDEVRARALFEYANDPEIAAIWCARGGSGAVRMLPYLDKWGARHGVLSPKLLVGYSDVTTLHEYARTRWGWRTLHAPMPGVAEFQELTPAERSAVYRMILTGEPAGRACGMKLKWLTSRPCGRVTGELAGGNLWVWGTLMGTPYAPSGRGRILFFEDVGEALYRIHRVVTQLELSGAFRGARAIVLGNFDRCDDTVIQVKSRPGVGARRDALLRAVVPRARGLREIFGELGERLGIPVASGLPVGHGPGAHFPLPLGARASLAIDGRFSIERW